MKLIKNTIEDIFKKSGREDLLYKSEINSAINEIFGENLSKKIIVRYFKDGKLFLEAENSIWAYELSLNKGNLIEKINEKLSNPVIKEIITR
ncbi:MAG TPA: DUF721 domain-containing protein [Candidatus Kapabacteria bacterium]|mgnify:FL=1|jgi:hypothetical protein|nr:DUF721 domain-containing protein [Candidatus Kapabacteria bacterium]HOV92365.1 DUF721 domain-containing protein [Candidatus Kapabacteria bacterium]